MIREIKKNTHVIQYEHCQFLHNQGISLLLKDKLRWQGLNCFSSLDILHKFDFRAR